MLKMFYAVAKGLGSALPIGLGAMVWVGCRIGPEMIAPLVLAFFSAMAVVHFSAGSNRPLLFTI